MTESVEGFWFVRFGDAYVPGLPNAGVAILETGRVFGGDSQFYYRGHYQVDGERVTAQVRIAPIIGEGDTAFGTNEAAPTDVELEGRRIKSSIVGDMWRTAQPGPRLRVVLRYLEALP